MKTFKEFLTNESTDTTGDLKDFEIDIIGKEIVKYISSKYDISGLTLLQCKVKNNRLEFFTKEIRTNLPFNLSIFDIFHVGNFGNSFYNDKGETLLVVPIQLIYQLKNEDNKQVKDLCHMYFTKNGKIKNVTTY